MLQTDKVTCPNSLAIKVLLTRKYLISYLIANENHRKFLLSYLFFGHGYKKHLQSLLSIKHLFSFTFIRRFYPKRLSAIRLYIYIFFFFFFFFFFLSMCVPWELNPRPLALLTQCSTTEPQEHFSTSSVN